jgi:hypothetical protein
MSTREDILKRLGFTEEQYQEQLDALNSKSISECETKKTQIAHIGNAMPSFPRLHEMKIPELKDITSEDTIRIMQRQPVSAEVKQFCDDAKKEHDIAQAEIELSFINAAICLAEGSNEIGAEVTIAGITVGVSLNERLIPILQAEAEEIRKYLKGLPNNYE